MKAPHRIALQAAGIAAGLFTLLPSAATAQRNQCPGPETKKVLVTTFRGDPAAGINVADEIRNRIQGEYNCRTLMPSIKKDIDNTLVSSGYRPDSALNPNDIKELGKLLHSDEIIDGDVTKTAAGMYQVKARFFLARDVALSQPLGTFESKDFGDIAKRVVDEYDRGRKQIPDNQACDNGIREGKPAVAIAAARKGLISYPKSTLLRLCMASAYQSMKLSADSTGPWKDSVIAVTKQIIELDNASRIAYQLQYDAYKAKGDGANSLSTLLGWMSADPTNATLREQVVAEIINSGDAAKAVPIARQLMADNAGDPQYARLYWLVLRATKNYKESVPAGIAYVTLDSAAADSGYFDRQISDLTTDSAYAKAAEMAAMAAAKYPRSTAYLVQKAQLERRTGQIDASKASLERALAIDPKVNGANYLLAQIAIDKGKLDDALKYAKADIAQSPGNKERVSLLVMSAGSGAMKAAQASKSNEDYKKALVFFQAADELNPTAQSAYFIAATAFSIVQGMGDQLRTTHSCEEFKLANDMLVLVNINIPKGASVDKNSAGAIMGAAQQYGPFIETSIKKYCK